MGRFRRLLPPLVVVALLLGWFAPWPSSHFPPAEAQVGGARALTDTQRVPTQFHVFKVSKGQREWVAYSWMDSQEVAITLNLQEVRQATLLDSAVKFVDPADKTKVARFDAENVPTGVTVAVSFQPTSGTMYITGGQDVALADGGTGASTAAAARSNLGTDDAANITTGNLPIARVTSTDGSGSGLDADLLDGLNATSAATASTIASRDGSGRLAVAEPSASGDAATKNYVDTQVAAAGKIAAAWTYVGSCASTGSACGSWDFDSYTADEFLIAIAGNGDSAAETNWMILPVEGLVPTSGWVGFSGNGYTAKPLILHGYGILGTSTYNIAIARETAGGNQCDVMGNTASTNIIEGLRSSGSGTCYFGLWRR